MTILARDLNQRVAPVAGYGASQDVAYTGTAADSSAMGTNTKIARLLATTDCRVKVSSAGTDAVSTDTYLVAFTEYFVKVAAGDIISAIRVSASGTLNITEMT